MTTRTDGMAALDAVEAMRRAWPRHQWGDPGQPRTSAADYGEALLEVGDAAAIAAGVKRAIRETTGFYPPPIGALLAMCREEAAALPPLPIPAVVPNKCPVCREAGVSLPVEVDERTRLASCTDGLHRHTWRVR